MIFHKLILIGFLFLPLTILVSKNENIFAYAAEDSPGEDAADVLEGEDEAHVEEPDTGGDLLKTGEDEDEDESEDRQLKPSSDADTFFLFTRPAGLTLELPSGKDVHFLVGFANKGSKPFIVDTMDASFRYAQDFSFHLQNFSAIAYNRLVKPDQEVTLAYHLFVSDAYSARPYGFTVNLFYRDADGNQYMNAVFNETVTIVELDEGLDGETFFLYIFLAACVILALVGVQQFLSSLSRKKSGSSRPQLEIGTSNPNDVDYDWVPQETLNHINKASPKVKKEDRKTKSSPRIEKRRVKRGTGAADD